MINKINKGISILKNGGLVAYPTDTVYGLGACADNIQAVKRIYTVKKRPLNMPLPLLLADISWINRITSSIPAIARPLIERFMPGALTLVLPKSNSISDIVSGGKNTIALRVPAHPVAIALIKGTGSPVVGTSANISGHPSPLTAEEVKIQLGSSIDYIIDGGKCPGGTESTIVDVTGEIPVILRQGAITREEIEKVCEVLASREES
jgi:L-threonylcarbamoyladenylate synthase